MTISHCTKAKTIYLVFATVVKKPDVGKGDEKIGSVAQCGACSLSGESDGILIFK